MKEKDFYLALLEVIQEALEGVEWPASEHAKHKLNRLRERIEDEGVGLE